MFVFFFQAEDGIRDGHVTGVQTCALPIWELRLKSTLSMKHNCNRESLKEFLLKIYSALQSATPHQTGSPCDGTIYMPRSEERRVGKEWRYRWSPEHGEKKKEKARRMIREK